jgi:hypothetical protein
MATKKVSANSRTKLEATSSRMSTTLSGDYGKCSIDAAAAFNGYALYDLPFGRRKAVCQAM